MEDVSVKMGTLSWDTSASSDVESTKYGKTKNVFVNRNMQKLTGFVDSAQKIRGLPVMEAGAFARRDLSGTKKQDYASRLSVLLTQPLSGKMESMSVNVTKDTFGGRIGVFLIAGKMKFLFKESACVRRTTLRLIVSVLNAHLNHGLRRMEPNVCAKKIFIGILSRILAIS